MFLRVTLLVLVACTAVAAAIRPDNDAAAADACMVTISMRTSSGLRYRSAECDLLAARANSVYLGSTKGFHCDSDAVNDGFNRISINFR